MTNASYIFQYCTQKCLFLYLQNTYIGHYTEYFGISVSLSLSLSLSLWLTVVGQEFLQETWKNTQSSPAMM